ncbi:uncharacterized protein LOC128992509 isoform X2 [Macrosteles quadrilineatus]|uniref:uncharacterized protein LOC128992509 isoform X2 n=1 Tax=Macrosteles quadrilineatus TaxID=74068 RepID=UPI0023E2CBF6|nr:uncharacterized protein LOC128992509 isoform X2 [Macrosteles quadrilineatus]
MSADSATFGNPCHHQSRMYLKVVYTCVPRTVLREQYEERPEKDETLDTQDTDIDAYDVVDDALRESSVYSASPVGGADRPGGANTSVSAAPSEAPPRYHTSDPSPRENREKLVLYLSVSISAGLLSLLVLVITRLLWQRRRPQIPQSTTLPSYVDDLSEVDTDIDLTSTAPATITILSSPLPPGEVVRFGSESSAPRSLSRSGNNQYYYG